jgi:hypothetical protein
MKKCLLLLACTVLPWTLRAHDHIEIGLDPGTPGKLKVISGQVEQLLTHFPLGEVPSYSTYAFPGGAYATVLTFSAFDNTAPPPNGALIRVDILSVSGPDGGAFSFWEVGAETPTWSRASGWTSSPTDKPSLFASEDGTGYGHIHGRAFSTSKAGIYDVTFQAVDTTGRYVTSDPFVVRFTAVNAPQLAIGSEGGNIKLTFTSRANLAYDLQSSTTLKSDSWTTITTLDGSGGTVEFSEPLNNRPRIFYRLVEYQ